MGTRSLKFLTATAVFVIISAVVLQGVSASGIFELDLLSLNITDGREITGGCCSENRPLDDSSCPDSGCSVFLHFCVKHYQQQVDMRSACTFFEFDTGVLRKEGHPTHYDVREQKRVTIDFQFRWPGPFSLVVDAWHPPEGSDRIKTLVERFVSQHSVDVDPEWTKAEMRTSRSNLWVKFRVVCDANYYGSKCSVYCRDRNDKFGHYTCTADGNRRCLSGWTNKEGDNDTYCTTPHCDPKCVNGICSNDSEDHNVCRCLSGWMGPSCNKCTPLYNCVHGKCETDPKQCFCDEGWGGLQCDQDLNYCTNHKPCQHGGTCTNTVKDGKGHYNCSCAEDFMGNNCEILKNPCLESRCENGASCTNPRDGEYTCQCAPGYFGEHCETWANICSENICENGGSCIHDPNGFICACPAGYTGLYCEEVDHTNCRTHPCINGGSCVNSSTGFHCQCPPGVSGPRCETTARCSSTACDNGGTCTEAGGDVACVCPSGFSGTRCQINHNRCSANPCANGATCVNLLDGVRCQCAEGYHGQFCDRLRDPCASAPCLNGAACRPTAGGFACRCLIGFRGDRCHLAEVDGRHPSVPSNVSHRVSGDEGDGTNIALIACLSTLAVISAILLAGAGRCLLLRRKSRRGAAAGKAKDCDFEEDERVQNERNARHMNNKQCDNVVPQVIVNELDRGPAKVTNENPPPKVLNTEAAGSRMSLDKAAQCPPRPVQKTDNTSGSSVSSRSSQDRSPYHSGSIFVIEDHLKLQPPRLLKQDMLATEV